MCSIPYFHIINGNLYFSVFLNSYFFGIFSSVSVLFVHIICSQIPLHFIYALWITLILISPHFLFLFIQYNFSHYHHHRLFEFEHCYLTLNHYFTQPCHVHCSLLLSRYTPMFYYLVSILVWALPSSRLIVLRMISFSVQSDFIVWPKN